MNNNQNGRSRTTRPGDGSSIVKSELQTGLQQISSTGTTSETQTTTQTSEDGKSSCTTTVTSSKSETAAPVDPYNKAANVLTNASVIQSSLANLSVNENYTAYYTNIVKPSVDMVYFLSLGVQSLAGAANAYQCNNYGKKHEIKKAIDLSYEVLDELEKVIKLLDCSLDCLIDRSGFCVDKKKGKKK